MSGFVRVGDGRDGAGTVDDSSCILWFLRYDHCFANLEGGCFSIEPMRRPSGVDRGGGGEVEEILLSEIDPIKSNSPAFPFLSSLVPSECGRMEIRVEQRVAVNQCE
jgi:hypothetical protein